MKKIINTPNTIVPEMCSGISLAHPDLQYFRSYNILMKKKLDGNKVTLISGGGSGHEPAHAGYIGDGMLDVAVCGDVFASPSQVQVYQAIRRSSSKKGTLLIIKNYSGDVMNFLNGAAMAKEEGISVEYVKVEDDIAVQDSLYTVGRRGVAGTVFVHKVAGAAARDGLSLLEVKQIAQHASNNIRSIGFAYSSCTVPASGVPTFEIGKDEMEYGIGIHGEPGRVREKIISADEIAMRMVAQLVGDFKIRQGSEIALLINGFGGTPIQELYVLTNSAFKALGETGIKVYRCLVGNYMTSLDMCGASMSLMTMDDLLKKYIDAPCKTPGLNVYGSVEQTQYSSTNIAKKTIDVEVMRCDSEWYVVEKEHISLENIFAMICIMTNCIISNEAQFCKMDSYAGDGDFGTSIAKGFKQIRNEWDDLLENSKTIGDFLIRCSLIIMEHSGGASGPIWGSAFRSAGIFASTLDKVSKKQFASMFHAIIEGIQKTCERSFGRGTVVGDKTLIDALVPCSNSLDQSVKESDTWKCAFENAAKAAVQGAESTKGIVARMGRAGTVGKRSLGYPDAGACALGVIFTEIAQGLSYPRD